ncbi:MAG: hypothetical protein RIT43_1367 [Bacteroidota bacterium]
MRLFIGLVCIFLVFPLLHSQRTLSKNLWTSAVFRYKTNRAQFTGDLGFRMCDDFIHANRTALARLTIEKTFKKSNNLGVGYAYFEHYINALSIENRLFAEYSKQFDAERTILNVRFRGEIRTFNDRKTNARLRIQAAWVKDLSRFLETRLSSELFYSPGKDLFIEQRYSAGLAFRINTHVKFMPFYTLQWQSNVHYPQHIVGTQLQMSLENLTSGLND